MGTKGMKVWRKCSQCWKGVYRLEENADRKMPKHVAVTHKGFPPGPDTYDTVCEGSFNPPVHYSRAVKYITRGSHHDELVEMEKGLGGR